MKKILYLFLFFLLITLIYLGGSYYTHQLALKKLDIVTEKLNSSLSTLFPAEQLNKQITFKNTVENSSLFNSTHRIILEVSDPNAATNDRHSRKRTTLFLQIESGLFPLSNIKALNFRPVLNKFTLQIPTSVLEREWLERENVNRTAPLATIRFMTHFNQQITFESDLSPFNYQHPETPLSMGKSSISGILDANDLITEVSAHLTSFEAKLNSPWIPVGHVIDNIIKLTEAGIRHHVKFSDLTLNYKADPLTPGFNTAKKNLFVKDFSFAILQYPILQMNLLNLSQEQFDRTELVEIENTIELKQLNVYGLDIGSGNTTFISLHRNVESMRDFYQEIYQDIKNLKYKRTQVATDLSINKFLNGAQNTLKRLESHVGFQINPLHWENEVGMLNLKSELLFSNPLSLLPDSTDKTSAIANINSFHVDLKAQLGVLPRLKTKFDQINGIEYLTASKNNNQLVKNNLDLLVNAGIIIINDDFANFTFSFAQDKYLINGITYTKDQFFEFLSLVSLRQNGLISPDNLIKLNEFISIQRGEN